MILSCTPKLQEQMYIILPPKEINSHTNRERQGETTPIQTSDAITRKKNKKKQSPHIKYKHIDIPVQKYIP